MASEDLTEDQLKFLEECNLEFCDRFTDSDLEFMKIYESDIPIPPIMYPWNDRSKFNNRGRNGPNRYNNWSDRRNNYDSNYRDRDNRSHNRDYNRAGGSGGYRDQHRDNSDDYYNHREKRFRRD